MINFNKLWPTKKFFNCKMGKDDPKQYYSINLMVIMKPPPMPELMDLTTPLQKRAAKAASTALPPRSNILLFDIIFSSLTMTICLM